MKRKSILIFIALVFVLGACASVKLDTPEKKYLAARSELNLLLEQYIPIQDNFSSTDQKNIKAAAQSADMALDAWEKMLGNENYNYLQDMRTWLSAKDVIVKIMQKYVVKGATNANN